MNAKQSLKAASKLIEEKEDYIQRCIADIKAYNQVIEDLIKGGDPCKWCEDREECQLQAKGKGCEDWMLAMNLKGVESYDETEEVTVRPADAAGVDGSGSESGRGDGVGSVPAGIDGEHQEQAVREK